MIFKGTATALITPFTEDDKVDEKALCNIVEHQIASGVNALVALGTTAETATLSEEEKKQIISLCVRQTRGRVPILVGAGSNSTAHAVESCRIAQECGADGLLIVTPYYNKCTQEGLVRHYGAIAHSTSLPLVCYNVPSRTGVNMLPETFARICEENKNVAGIKEASGNISQVADIMQMTQGDIDIYSGNDDQIVPILSLGGKGVISVLSNVCPKETHDIVARFMDGDVAGSRDLQLRALPLVHALFCEVNPIPVKTALNLMGMEVGPLRLPMTPMEEANKARLIQAMKDFGVAVK